MLHITVKFYHHQCLHIISFVKKHAPNIAWRDVVVLVVARALSVILQQELSILLKSNDRKSVLNNCYQKRIPVTG